MPRFRVMLAAALSAALLAGSAGCAMRGDHGVTEQTAEKANLALQRESALAFRNEWQPNVDRIRFTHEGSRPGLGASWRVNAVATVGRTDYEVIIGPDIPPAFPTGYPPPRPSVSPDPVPLSVTYSDGTSEVME